MKKLVKAVAALLAVAVCMASGVVSYAEEAALPVEIKAKAAVLMDASTGKVLMKYNENEKLYPASVTKIMPLLLIRFGQNRAQRCGYGYGHGGVKGRLSNLAQRGRADDG